MTDVSDGLAAELRALAVANPDREFVVEADALPLDNGVAAAANRVGCAPYEVALEGGEDYELLVALPEAHLEQALHAVRNARPATDLTVIGRVRESRSTASERARVFLAAPGTGAERILEETGFEHFK
jgi:thiamine-monophosphate kinase